jgi:hypothetical protein
MPPVLPLLVWFYKISPFTFLKITLIVKLNAASFSSCTGHSLPNTFTTSRNMQKNYVKLQFRKPLVNILNLSHTNSPRAVARS